MVWRIIITVASWALGLAFGVVTDGKPFDTALWLLTAAAVATMPWLSPPPPTKVAVRRLGVVMLTLNAVAFLALLVTLPDSHQAQRRMQETESRSAANLGRKETR